MPRRRGSVIYCVSYIYIYASDSLYRSRIHFVVPVITNRPSVHTIYLASAIKLYIFFYH
jgi:hypothetical protein